MLCASLRMKRKQCKLNGFSMFKSCNFNENVSFFLFLCVNNLWSRTEDNAVVVVVGWSFYGTQSKCKRYSRINELMVGWGFSLLSDMVGIWNSTHTKNRVNGRVDMRTDRNLCVQCLALFAHWASNFSWVSAMHTYTHTGIRREILDKEKYRMLKWKQQQNSPTKQWQSPPMHAWNGIAYPTLIIKFSFCGTAYRFLWSLFVNSIKVFQSLLIVI